jgi:hypothetical protein
LELQYGEIVDYQLLVKWWEAALMSCRALGGRVITPLEIGPPANAQEIKDAEHWCKQTLPQAFNDVCQNFSKRVEFFWQLPDEPHPPEPLRGIFAGQCGWDLSYLPEDIREDWIDSCFPNPNNPYDRVWHNKLAFFAVANGDCLAIDLSEAQRAPVVYLSHDGGEGHGYELGSDFSDFLQRWTKLGCPGPEDWQWLPFTNSRTSLIDPECENARIWREWFGLPSN